MAMLTATDAYFAYADSKQAPMNIGSVQILKIPRAYRGNFFEEYKKFVETRLEYLPKLKMRLANDGMGLPHWVDYEDFNLDDHVRLTHLKASNGDSELSEKIGRLQLAPFEAGKPPFMFYVIEGLDKGRIAIVLKFHHAIADGKTAVRMMDLLSDEGLERAQRAEDREESYAPGYLKRTLSGALEDIRRTAVSVPGVLGLARTLMGEQAKDVLGRQSKHPKTIFNQPLSDKRLFVCRDWPLDSFNRARRHAGLTFNDMGLAMLGGALRRYLDEIDELPGESLYCNVPVALESSNSKSTGNAVLAISIPLGTHLGDRDERIAHLKSEAAALKSFIGEVADAATAGAGIQLPSYLIKPLGKLGGSAWLSQHMPSAANISMSNTPAPAKPVHVAGMKVDSLYGLPMVLHGLSICLAFSSYAGKVVCSIFGCAKALPDPERILDYMGEELAIMIEGSSKSSGK